MASNINVTALYPKFGKSNRPAAAGMQRGRYGMKAPDFGEATPPRGEGLVDQRQAARYILLIRSAKLVCDSGEFLCIVRDVSASGARLRLFHPVPQGEALWLELASGDRFRIEHRWNREGQFGFRFHDPIDVHRFIAEASPYPRRPVRLRIDVAASLLVNRESHAAHIRDLSRQGARIDTEQPLAIGQKLRLRAPGLPELEATVCWREAPAYGLVLRQGFSFETLARLAWQLQTGALPASEGFPADYALGAG